MRQLLNISVATRSHPIIDKKVLILKSRQVNKLYFLKQKILFPFYVSVIPDAMNSRKWRGQTRTKQFTMMSLKDIYK